MGFIDKALDFTKRTLVRFRKAKFGFMFLINIFKLPDFITDKRVNIISKAKVVFALLVGILYLIVGIDIVPEIITGFLGLFDDLFILVWSLGIVNEELEKYKQLIKKDKDPNIIENVKFDIKD